MYEDANRMRRSKCILSIIFVVTYLIIFLFDKHKLHFDKLSEEILIVADISFANKVQRNIIGYSRLTDIVDI